MQVFNTTSFYSLITYYTENGAPAIDTEPVLAWYQITPCSRTRQSGLKLGCSFCLFLQPFWSDGDIQLARLLWPSKKCELTLLQSGLCPCEGTLGPSPLTSPITPDRPGVSVAGLPSSHPHSLQVNESYKLFFKSFFLESLHSTAVSRNRCLRDATNALTGEILCHNMTFYDTKPNVFQCRLPGRKVFSL